MDGQKEKGRKDRENKFHHFLFWWLLLLTDRSPDQVSFKLNTYWYEGIKFLSCKSNDTKDKSYRQTDKIIRKYMLIG